MLPSMAGRRACPGRSVTTGLLVAGCRGGPAGPGATGTGSTTDAGSNGTVAPTVPTSRAPDESARSDLTSESVTRWTRYERAGDRGLRLFYSGGDPECFGARAVVEETADTVRAAVVTGRLPGAPEVCRQVATRSSIVVSLQQPLGERRVEHLDDPPLRR